MTLPTVTVSGTIKAPDGTSLDGKTVAFATTAEMVDAAGNVLVPILTVRGKVVAGALKAADGTSPLVLYASDTGTNTVPYTITESWSRRQFTVSLLTTDAVAGVINYSTLGPVSPAPTATSPYAELTDVEARDAATLATAEAYTDAHAGVNSVFGRTGAVVAQGGDYTAAQVGADATGAAAAAQAAAISAAATDATTKANNAVTTAETYADRYAGSAAGTAGRPLAATDATTTNARTPTGHHTTHSTGGSDAIAPADIGAAPVTTTTIDLVDRTNNTTETVPAGFTTNCSTAGVTKTAPALDNPVATPPKRFAVKNLATGSITVSYPDQAGATQTLTVLPGETRTFRQKSTSGWGVESGAIAVATLDARFQPLNLEGTLAARPAANTVPAKTVYWATDVAGGTLYRSDGSSWAQMAAGATVAGAIVASVSTTTAPTATTSTSVVSFSTPLVTSTFVADGTQYEITARVPRISNNTVNDGVGLYLYNQAGTLIDYMEFKSATANASSTGHITTLDTPTSGVTTSYELKWAALTGGTASINTASGAGKMLIFVRHG